MDGGAEGVVGVGGEAGAGDVGLGGEVAVAVVVEEVEGAGCDGWAGVASEVAGGSVDRACGDRRGAVGFELVAEQESLGVCSGGCGALVLGGDDGGGDAGVEECDFVGVAIEGVAGGADGGVPRRSVGGRCGGAFAGSVDVEGPGAGAGAGGDDVVPGVGGCGSAADCVAGDAAEDQFDGGSGCAGAVGDRDAVAVCSGSAVVGDDLLVGSTAPVEPGFEGDVGGAGGGDGPADGSVVPFLLRALSVSV